MRTKPGSWLPVGAALVFAGCASSDVYHLNLMPAPAIFGEAQFNPFRGKGAIQAPPLAGVLYATDREPVPDASPGRFYGNRRGHLLRLGAARVEVARPNLTWHDVQTAGLFRSRAEQFPLRVTAVDEFGVLPASITLWRPPAETLSDRIGAAERFVKAINQRLAASPENDVYVYVHGYRVAFENPVLVATELWHFLGYEGVFVAYSWPATPRLTAYFADAETATYAARNFRLFLGFLGTQTAAKRVHVIAYSAGTRMVIRALEQLALEYRGRTKDTRPRLGQVIIVGGDVDPLLVASAIADGLLDVVSDLTVYQSESDQALAFARRLLAQSRLGETRRDEPRHVNRVLHQLENLHVVSVSNAEGALTGNGHSYFRNSPWASSDILMTVRYALRPGERGLVRYGESPLWQFPPDYISRLSQAVYAKRPEWAPDAKRSGLYQPVPRR